MLITRTDGCYVDGTFGRGGHSRALLARLGKTARLTGIDRDPAAVAEGERLTAAAGQHDGARMQPLHLDPRHRPGVGPGPWLNDTAGRDGLIEGLLEQHLRHQRLGVDVGTLSN